MADSSGDTTGRTPLYSAIHNARYERRDAIRRIEALTGRKLLVYFAVPEAPINQHDVPGFGDLLYGLSDEPVDLLLQSPGGDIDVAEKIVNLIASRCSSFRVIVPESAKSAATLMALASDEIVMSDTSELGPIDPQVGFTTANGELTWQPATSFLDGLEMIRKQVDDSGGNLSPVYFPLLANLDPALLDYCQKAIERSQRFARKWLLRAQCTDEAAAAEIARKLADTKQYPSHGAMVDYKEATALGLKVAFHPHDDEVWDHIWRLYCKYEINAEEDETSKMFESSTVSLSI